MARVLPQPPLTVIAGPTGAGKTDLAVALAERLGAEIVSADSQAVYRHFDLGTAKPEPAQLARVPHHLVSVVEPNQPFSAARWVALADAAIADIAARGRPVLVVGGTGSMSGRCSTGSPTLRPTPRCGGRSRTRRTGWGPRRCTAGSPRWTRPPPRASPSPTCFASSGRWRSTPPPELRPPSCAPPTPSAQLATQLAS